MPTDPCVPWRRHLAVVFFGSFTTVAAMGLVVPFLPLYLSELGIHTTADLEWWSGLAYGATFLTAGLTAPLWGRLGDRYGRKLMLVRASLGMAVSTALMALVSNAGELVGLRLLTGLLGGYSSGSMILVAAQAPPQRSGWALGVLSSGIMAGNLVGPLAGGILPPIIGVRPTFLAAAALIFLAFLATVLLLRHDQPAREGTRNKVPFRGPKSGRTVAVLLMTGALLMVANLSVEPILSIFVASLGVDPHQATIWAGLALSASALGSLLSATFLGRLADRVGVTPVLVGGLGTAALLVIPQVFVTSGWQLILIRFLMGCALGGLLPSIAKGLRQGVPAESTGRMLGLSVSAQYAGQVAGPLAGGWFAGVGGIPAVLWGTSALLFAGALGNLVASRSR